MILAIATPVCAEQIGVDHFGQFPPADVLLIGELHDNPVHHENQAKAVRAIQPAALVFEMLTPVQAKVVNDSPELGSDDLAQALAWADSGWPDFGFYFPILTASEGQVFGGALPRDQVRRAFGEGAAAVFGKDADRFGLTDPLPEDQQTTREADQFSAHCEAMPIEMMVGMVEAQRLRDAALAHAVVQAYQSTGGPVVVITGNGHARSDWGVPHNLHLAAPDLSILSIGQFEAAPEPDTPFDLWLVTDPAEREDPCAAFQ